MTARLPLDGLLLVDKPEGVTSHDVVGVVRRTFHQREVGHAGTLDPFATGLLILGLGRATRLLRFVEAQRKRYLATVQLGVATRTYDRDGEVTEERSIDHLDEAQIRSAVEGLVGEVQQVVPAFSAVHIDGERAYVRARRGEVLDLPVRTVHIHALAAGRVALPEVELDATVSAGTYIRSLAVQLGAALSVPAHLTKLRRTEIGAHRLDEARPVDALRGDAQELLPLNRAVEGMAQVTVDSRGADDVRHGRRLSGAQLVAGGVAPGAPGDHFAVIGPQGALMAVATWRADTGADYACVLRSVDSD